MLETQQKMSNGVNDQTSQFSKPNRKVRWPIAAIIIVGAIAGGLVYGIWQAGVSLPKSAPADLGQPMASPTLLPEADEKTAALLQIGSSTEISDIEKDLQNTDLTGLDSEMNTIGSEIP
ncbi:MAG: hypothetical protein Q7S09_05405 [bacterium]|nr:hypothetical protein [bacterium]